MHNNNSQLFIGLMSGTSLDAIDAALCKIASSNQCELIATHSILMPESTRRELRQLQLHPESTSLHAISLLDNQIGQLFAECAHQLLLTSNIAPDSIAAIGSHGQTIYHSPHNTISWQIGDPNIIAEQSGITTIADFRRRDLAAGGQGAPLVPAFHAALMRKSDANRAILNLGGIANLTLLPSNPTARITGFDTGPANTLLDQWCHHHTGQPYDRDGAMALQGKPHKALLEALMKDSYIQRTPPKSTGPEYFNLNWLLNITANFELSPEDVQSTLMEFTCQSIFYALDHHMPEWDELIVCGGGTENCALMTRLRELANDRSVVVSDEVGMPAKWMEAMAFAWLAHQTLRGLPGNVDSVTGAKAPRILGGIYPA